MTPEEEISLNIELIQDRIKAACERSGRDPDEVKITAVSKKQSVGKMEIFSKYCRDHKKAIIFGESYVREFRDKKECLSKPYEVHLIGALQSNKAKEAVMYFDLIQSVHSEKLAREINKHAAALKKIQRIYIQINISKDPAKKGFTEEEAQAFIISSLPAYSNLRLEGLMTITKEYDNPQDARNDFYNMRKIRDAIVIPGSVQKNYLDLSMGMSDDYEVAIEEGATVVRIGTALFGARAA